MSENESLLISNLGLYPSTAIIMTAPHPAQESRSNAILTLPLCIPKYSLSQGMKYQDPTTTKKMRRINTTQVPAYTCCSSSKPTILSDMSWTCSLRGCATASSAQPGLKGSIGEGPNHSNHSNSFKIQEFSLEDSKISEILSNFQHFLNYRRNSDKISSKSEQKSVKKIQK